MADLAVVPEGKTERERAFYVWLREQSGWLPGSAKSDRLLRDYRLAWKAAWLAASPTPPSIGVTLPSEELVDEMGRAMWAVDDPNSPYEAHYYHPMARAILQLIERKTGRKG